jgi:hypothetical protein
MFLVTRVITIIKWNGNLQRGPRQGDSRSPYIFVMRMYILSHLIAHEVERRRLKAIKVRINCLFCSHLMFASDI